MSGKTPQLESLTVTQDLDTDAINPDVLKTTFDVVIDSLVSRAEGHRVALNWNSIKIALVEKPDPKESMLVMKAEVLQ